MEEVVTIISISILFCLSIPDLGKKKIPIWMIRAGSIIAIAFRIIFTALGHIDFSLLETITAFLPGFIFLGLAFVTREQIGYGDGLIILLLGILYSFWELITIIGIALSITSFVSIFLLISRKGNRNTRLPFVPFLFLAAIIECGLKSCTF